MLLNNIRWAGTAAAACVLALVAGAVSPLPVRAQAADTVVNVATVVAPDGTQDVDPANDTGSATVAIGPRAAEYSFCAAPNGSAGSNAVYGIVNGVQIWRYEPGDGADAPVPELALPTVAGDVNGLMVDPVNDRLLFHAGNGSMVWAYDAGNGGWYQALAAGLPVRDFPRAGMDADGVGYLIGSGGSPAVYRLTSDGGYGYSAQSIGVLQYDEPPTNIGSGDIAFDADGFGWLAAGQDLYRIDFSAPGDPRAVRQTRPLLDGEPSTVQWAGVAFGDDGRLYVANNNSPSRYYAYDPATGDLTVAAPTGAGGSRDLASCAHPAIAEPALSVRKTLAEVNGQAYAAGAAVAPGDLLTYSIVVGNAGGAVGTLFPGDVAETVPAHTAHVATGSDFACTGSDCANTSAINVPAGGEAALAFVVRVDDPLPADASAIANAVTFPNGAIDCGAAGNDCDEVTPLGPTIAVAKRADPGAGTAVAAGRTITYALDVTVANAATRSDLVLTDTLGEGLTFGAVVEAGGFQVGGSGAVRTFTLPAGAAPGDYSVVYTATVDEDAQASVANAVQATGGGDPGAPPPDCADCGTEHPLATTVVVAKSSDPATGTEVSPGDTLTYTLTATVANAATTEALTLVDTLGEGLGFGEVTDAGAFACSGALTCTLPAGTLPGSYALTYTATVDADATGVVRNAVTASVPPGGNDPEPVCAACETEHPLVPTSITVVKSSDPAAGTEVSPGDTLTYTLTATVANSATTGTLTLVDTLGEGLGFGEVTDAGAFACSGALTCTLPAGTLPGTYALTYTATVDGDATGTLRNAVTASVPPGGNDPDPVCAACGTEHEVVPTSVTVSKSSDPAPGGEVSPGDTLTYTLTATVANSATTEALTLVDTLGEGLGFGEVTDAGAFACSGALTCTLPAGTLPGTYALTYTATVDGDATGTLRNAVTASVPPGGTDPEPVCTACGTEHRVVPTAITVVKSADPAPGGEVSPGDTLTYTLTVTVANSATTEVLTLVDTLGAGLGFGEVTDAGAFACSGALTCTLPAGTLPGAWALSYTATVDADATGALRNAVTATNPAGGTDPDPVCGSCGTEHRVVAPTIVVTKSATPGDGVEVRAGDTIAYTLTATVAASATVAPLVLTDTPGDGLAFGEVTDTGAFSCSGALICTLPAGALPGSYTLTYTATVEAGATGTVGNVVAAAGGTGEDGPPPECPSCSTGHPLADPRVIVAKSAAPGEDQEVRVGDTIEYTLTATVENSATLADVRLVDTPGPGLAVGALPAGCAAEGATVVCVLPAGAVPGVYAFAYPATVTADANGSVENVVVGEYVGGEGEPECGACRTRHEVADEAQLRIVKSVGARNVVVGDLVRYTLTVENVGAVNVTGAAVVDTPPAGFNYVEGSMAVADRDGAFTLEGRYPLRIGALDIDAGERATIVYLLRVGAGVRQGVQVNRAMAVDATGERISNVATAQVVLDADQLLDDSLIFGTVFDDRDGDGWQDSAELSGVRVQGGFAPGAYVAGSTTIDRGEGPQPVADASAPLLHGIDIGTIAARQSEADPVAAHRVIVRQRLRTLDFTDDFVLTSAQGIAVRMDAAGVASVSRSGDAAKGLTAADPVVGRRVSAVDGGYEVAYEIGNAGIDERGIPGVRIASVDGLLIETDQYGRYHLADVQGGERGYRNFILKVDPSTLPPGTAFTTDNPLVRRITPGVPVRFDFGVRLPAEPIPGGAQEVELSLGEVIFAPGSAGIREAYLPAIERMAGQVDAYGGGEVVIAADGDTRALAYDRANAVRDALLARVSAASAAALSVNVRAEESGELVAGATEGGALLGTVLFDTDRAAIRPEFEALLDAVAARLERLGGGAVTLVGHADVRGPRDYNAALGLRRAEAVQRALAARLGPEVRARVRVDAGDDPAIPAGAERE